MSPARVAVLGGGVSSEREISLVTAAAVLEHLPRDEFDPLRVEILADGRWELSGRVVPAEDGLRALREEGVAVVFPGLHGPGGEDGRIQGFLEVGGFAYVGSGVAASAIAMDKVLAREVLGARGMPLPRALHFTAPAPGAAREVAARLGEPVVLKRPAGGSSLEVRIATREEEVEALLSAWLARPGDRVLVEERVAGEEVTCPVLGNASVGGGLRALPPVLVRPLTADSFTYEAKYGPRACEKLCPAPLPPGARSRVEELALLAHRALRCDGMTRSDFIVPPGGEPRFLEINTLPGLTPHSLCPASAAAAGLSFPDLLRELLRLAIEKGVAPGAPYPSRE